MFQSWETSALGDLYHGIQAISCMDDCWESATYHDVDPYLVSRAFTIQWSRIQQWWSRAYQFEKRWRDVFHRQIFLTPTHTHRRLFGQSGRCFSSTYVRKTLFNITWWIEFNINQHCFSCSLQTECVCYHWCCTHGLLGYWSLVKIIELTQ